MKRFLSFVALMIAPLALAQQLDHPVAVPVSYSGKGHANGISNISFTVTITQAVQVVAPGSTIGGDYYSSGVLSTGMIPGKEYNVTVTGTNTDAVTLDFDPTPGQVIYIDGFPSGEILNALQSSHKVRLEYRNDPTSSEPGGDSLAGKAGGACTSLPEDKPIFYIGLGSLRSGRFAGAVGFRASSITSALFNSSALIFDAIDAAIVVQRDANQHLTQIDADDVTIKVDSYNASGTQYSMKCYAPGASAPYITYTISQCTIATVSGLRIDKVEDDVNWSTALTSVSNGSGTTWTRYGWQRLDTASTAFDAASAVSSNISGSSETVTYGTDTNTVTKTKNFSGGELASLTWGNATLGQRTDYVYYGSTTSWPSAVQSITEPTGNWTKYDYYDTGATDGAVGMIYHEYHPWLDTPSTAAGASASSGYVVTNKYAAGYDGLLTAISDRLVTINGTTVAHTAWTYNWTAGAVNTFGSVSVAQKDYADSASYLTTTTVSYRPDISDTWLRSRPHSVVYPTTRKDSYAYFVGTWSSTDNDLTAGGDDHLVMCYHGQTSGGTAVTSVTNAGTTWNVDSVNMLEGYSTVSETVTDARGRLIFTGEFAYRTGGTLELVTGTKYTYDDHGRVLIATDAIRGTSTSHTYAAASAGNFAFTEAVTAPDGVVTKYEYDALLRLDTTVIGDNAPSIEYPAKTHQTVYNSANLPSKTYTCSCGTSPVVLTYDTAGRLTYKYEKSPNDPDDNMPGTLATHYEYPSVTQTRTTSPTGAVRIEENYPDGHQRSVTGGASPDQYWNYAFNSTGILVTQSGNSAKNLNNGGTVFQYDYLGRTTKQSVPQYGYNASTASTKLIDVASTYDPTTGLLTLRQTTDASKTAPTNKLLPDERLSYDVDRLQYDGLDVNEDNALTEASNDRLTKYDRKLVRDASGNWSDVADIWKYGVTASSSTATLTSETKTQLTGLSSTTIATISSTDSAGRVSTATTTLDSANKRRTTTTTVTGASNTATTRTDNGYDSVTKLLSGEYVKRTYDSDGRLYQVKSLGTSETTFGATDTYSYYGSTQYVHVGTVGGVQSTYSYAWGTGGARTVTISDAYGNSHYTTFNAMDLLSHIGGTGAVPVAYTYDNWGRRTDMTMYADATNTVSETNWPATGNTTHWELDAATALVKEKRFADYATVATDKTIFTYTALGQVSTRTTARGVTTTYGYYDGSTGTHADISFRTQEPKSISYSDGTTPMAFAYRRSGLFDTVGDAAGTRTFAYLSNPYLLDTETFDNTFYNSRVVKRGYDTALRDVGFTITNGTTTELSQAATMAGATTLLDHIDATNSSSRTFSYGYKPSLSLVDNYATGGSSGYKASYDYDGTSAARRTRVEGAWSTVSVTRFDLTYDAVGFVQSAKQSGSAFADYYSGTGYSSVYNWYSYDSAGQLQSAITYRGTPPASGAPASGDQLPGRRFEYRYDGSSNRKTVGAVGAAFTNDTPPRPTGDDRYSPNSLNQYDWKENNNVRILGTAASSAAVSASSTDTTDGSITVTKVDRNFAADIAPNNPSSTVKGTATITATQGGTTNTVNRDWQVASQQQSLHYDADGNLDDDSLWTYTYDGEDRVKQIKSKLPAGAGYTRLQLDFKYDYRGRRIEKTVTNLETTSVTSKLRFLYDGWNLVAEYDASGASPTISRTFAWGLDVNGALSHVGHAGALLQIVDRVASKTYLPTYDASGNVSNLLDAADGTVVATYEYGPFGEPLRREEAASGGYAKNNPFRFSTKYTDEETGLVYYGMRFYSPTMGRFINRDPAEEGGGLNLHAFVGNNPINAADVLGLVPHQEVQCSGFIYINGQAIPFPCKLVWVEDPVQVTADRISFDPIEDYKNQQYQTPIDPGTPQITLPDFMYELSGRASAAPNKTPCAELAKRQDNISVRLRANRSAITRANGDLISTVNGAAEGSTLDSLHLSYTYDANANAVSQAANVVGNASDVLGKTNVVTGNFFIGFGIVGVSNDFGHSAVAFENGEYGEALSRGSNATLGTGMLLGSRMASTGVFGAAGVRFMESANPLVATAQVSIFALQEGQAFVDYRGDINDTQETIEGMLGRSDNLMSQLSQVTSEKKENGCK